MPKTTKTTRKASSASTKKSGLKRRFDLTNRKVQFFVVIGIVAILGGGWFTYTSFADYVSYTFSAAQIQKSNISTRCTYSLYGSDPGKNISRTIDVTCKPGQGAIFFNTPDPEQAPPALYKACVTVKGSGRLKVQLGPYGETENFVNNNGQYHTYCSKPVYLSLETRKYYTPEFEFGRQWNAWEAPKDEVPVLAKVSQVQVINVNGNTPTPTLGK